MLPKMGIGFFLIPNVLQKKILLKILIGEINPKDFYSEIKSIAEKNLLDEKEIVPTRKQMVDLLVGMNTNKNKKQITDVVIPFMEHHMGKIIMN